MGALDTAKKNLPLETVGKEKKREWGIYKRALRGKNKKE